MNHYTKRVLKEFSGWQLVRVTQLKYFKKGRANMHVEVRYHVEHQNPDVMTGCFNMTNKKEALAVWKLLIKNRELGGAKLKDDLFEIGA